MVAGGPSLFLPAPAPGSPRTPAPAAPQATTVPGLPAASYDRAADRWRELPRVPVDSRSVPSLAWTGWSVVAVSPRLAGAAYAPGARAWTPLPAPPEEAKVQSFAGFWTGREVLLVGSGGVAFDPNDGRCGDCPRWRSPRRWKRT